MFHGQMAAETWSCGGGGAEEDRMSDGAQHYPNSIRK